ncbi:MAG: SDR family oxidoreductase [Chlamydiae bacterium]|nr:SDR family oxidoreductase [Chlamydiota bacterium]
MNVFVTGATGFIGKRLIAILLQEGHTVYALCRIQGTKVGSINHPNLHIVYGDLEEPEKILNMPKQVDVSYYLVHSMAKKIKDLEEKEGQVAENFVALMEKAHCKQVIYLGGIIDPHTQLSPHLKSRKMVEDVLKKGLMELTVFRSSIIIGAGSASFEIIRDLVEKLPIMVAPRWVNTKCQPIAIADVLFYLKSALLNKEAFGGVFDIGGPDVYTFKEVLLRYAKFRELKRYIINVPFLTPKFSSYWLVFVTSVPYLLCSYLVESMKSNSICLNNDIQKKIPHACITFEQALERAFFKIANHQVESTWMDAWVIDQKSPDIAKFSEIPTQGCFKEVRKMAIYDSKEQVIERIWKIGGSNGWHGVDWAWAIRGLIDKIFHGPGLNRGRRHPTEIEVGDAIDFWRVVKADKKDGDLILYAEMHLPGKAWLEFQADDQCVYQITVFQPKGVFGRLYWYLMLPFHAVIFKKMICGIAGYK